MMTRPNITIYTDGSYKSKTHNGGWACLIVAWPFWTVLSGGAPETTIIRMELLAVIRSLEFLSVPSNVTVVSDNMYVVNCINKWVFDWRMNRWRTSKNTPVENYDLIRALDMQLDRHVVQAMWVKSHTNKRGVHYLGNNCVDWFAQHSADEYACW